jgi:hypothetical protein
LREAVRTRPAHSFALKRKDRLPIVFHADNDPGFVLRLSHERIAECSDLRLGALGVLPLGIVVMNKHHAA